MFRGSLEVQKHYIKSLKPVNQTRFGLLLLSPDHKIVKDIMNMVFI